MATHTHKTTVYVGMYGWMDGWMEGWRDAQGSSALILANRYNTLGTTGESWEGSDYWSSCQQATRNSRPLSYTYNVHL